mmetsp:Transcript_6924/g.19499  ORF Transcript_6924/g.19499 Transcript_6924/m.19499 type:complete len:445 (+) Transcript_6924:358-1692(+)
MDRSMKESSTPDMYAEKAARIDLYRSIACSSFVILGSIAGASILSKVSANHARILLPLSANPSCQLALGERPPRARGFNSAAHLFTVATCACRPAVEASANIGRAAGAKEATWLNMCCAAARAGGETCSRATAPKATSSTMWSCLRTASMTVSPPTLLTAACHSLNLRSRAPSARASAVGAPSPPALNSSPSKSNTSTHEFNSAQSPEAPLKLMAATVSTTCLKKPVNVSCKRRDKSAGFWTAAHSFNLAIKACLDFSVSKGAAAAFQRFFTRSDCSQTTNCSWMDCLRLFASMSCCRRSTWTKTSSSLRSKSTSAGARRSRCSQSVDTTPNNCLSSVAVAPPRSLPRKTFKLATSDRMRATHTIRSARAAAWTEGCNSRTASWIATDMAFKAVAPSTTAPENRRYSSSMGCQVSLPRVMMRCNALPRLSEPSRVAVASVSSRF